MSKSFNFKIVTSNTKLAYSNRVYVNKDDFSELEKAAIALRVDIPAIDKSVNVNIGTLVFQASPNIDINTGEVALNIKQRNCGSFTLNQPVVATIFIPTSDVALASMSISLDLLGKKAIKTELNVDELATSFKSQFINQVFASNQQLVMDFNGVKLDLLVENFDHAVIDKTTSSKSNFGQLLPITNLSWKKMNNSTNNIKFVGDTSGPMRNDNIFREGFNFETLGIGGLDEQFQKMFRTAFASRLFPGIVKQLGINHIRGILLYGPPGCGKTLIARQIGKVLNAREPKIVNGPEILNKYVGGSEEKIRELFADAEKEQAEAGDASMLHIIIFDEMDAIMKTRGSVGDSTGVSDSVVNQLLSKIDGVDSLNNILIIGMTNRKDLIDEAILRPGRLEVHIEVSLPDEKGRIQIIHIKTNEMIKNNRLSAEAIERLPELAALTKNYTGAELEGLVRNAASFALSRCIDAKNLKTMDDGNVLVEWRDFERALNDTIPAFGNKDNNEITSCYRNGVHTYGENFDNLWATIQKLINQTRNSTRTPLMSVLLEGSVAVGKTAIAAKLASESDFPFIRMISPDTMIGYTDTRKCSTLFKIFNDSYRSPLSIIFIDDIERLIEYTPVGMRFSNPVLQTLLILIKKIPPINSRLLIVATTSIASLMEDIQITQSFNVTLHVPQLSTPSEIYKILKIYSNLSEKELVSLSNSFIKPIGIKQLLMVLEMARDEETSSYSVDNFIECLHTIGY